MTELNDIVVAGTGPVGMVAALALEKAGFAVCLIGPAVGGEDRRTTALMNPALDMLDRIGVLDVITPQAAPLAVMRIVDATARLVRSQPVTFRASEIGERAFGLNMPNSVLNSALEARVAQSSAIAWQKTLVSRWEIGADGAVAHLAGGSQVTTRLVVAADGRLSPARAAAGIATTQHPYEQAALVLNFSHAREHGSISTEFHTESGPFTQVPLPGRRSSLVWVVTPRTAEALAARPDAELSTLVEDRMQSMLGRVSVEPGRQVYPLAALLPARFAQNRVALIGEAAHVFPPIGAQGLNLGIRDVADLVDIVSQNRGEPGSARMLAAYDARRRPDILARSGAVNLLNRSLLSDLLPAQLARSAGLGFLGGFAPVRAFFMREGMRPGSGFSTALSSLREQVRR